MPNPITAPADDKAGRGAPSPWAIPAPGWKAVLTRTWKEAGDDNVGLIAAGTAFYGFLAIVPLLGAIVMLYGLVATPETVMQNVRGLFGVLPEDAASLISEQLVNVERTSGGKQGLGLAVALALALYGATKGASSIVIALNVAYEQKETRGFIKLNLLSLAITLGAVVLALVAIASVAALALLDSLIPGAPAILLFAIKMLTYVVMAAIGVTGAACLYRYGPDRDAAKWSWLSPGSLAATALWLAGTIGFGIYASNFGSYNATYGSLGAVVVLLTWLWLSAYVFLLGAEMNSELERQTARDTTTGGERPLGTRGAVAADEVAGEPSTQAGRPAAESMSGSPEAAREAGPASVPATALQMKLAARMGGTPVGLPTALLAAAGLSALRRGSAKAGAALIAAGAALAWLGRTEVYEPENPDDTSASSAP